jgi:hypothetical protein
MTPQSSGPASLSLDQLLEFREVTERVSSYLYKRVKDHLGALTPLLAPGRVLGKQVGARESARGAEEAMAELAVKYKQAVGSPFDLKPDLDDEVLSAIGSGIYLYPYEYTHEAKGARSANSISMTSPVRWIVTYGSEYTLSQIRNLMRGTGERRAQAVRQFVVNALAFQVVLARTHGAATLLGDLRYGIQVESIPGLEKLPLVNLSVPIPSFRPSDELLLTATRLSGVPAFIELIDIEGMRGMQDPFRQRIEDSIREPA